MNIQPTFDVRADVQDTTDLRAAKSISRITAKYEGAPAWRLISERGRVDGMNDSFKNLGLGLTPLVAAVLVYGIMVINFQSWLDPFIHHHGPPGCGN
jgi:multidrug efflux pump subunit AcrB